MQCAEAAMKATNALRSMRGSFKSITKECFIILLNTYVRPPGSDPIWNIVSKYGNHISLKTLTCSRKFSEEQQNLWGEYHSSPIKTDCANLACIQWRDRGILIELYKMFTKKGYIRAADYVTLAGDHWGGLCRKLNNKPRWRMHIWDLTHSPREWLISGMTCQSQ